MKDKSFSMKIFIILLCTTAFFFNAIGNGYYMLLLCLVPVFPKAASLLTRAKLNTSVALLFFLLFACFSTVLSVAREESYKFIFMLLMLLIIKFVLEDSFGWQKYFSKVLFFITAVSVAATLLSLVIPDVLLDLAKSLYQKDIYREYARLFNNESYAGLYGQTGINAHVISMFLAFVVASLFSNKKARLNYLLLGAGIIALLLTKKRSFLISNIIAALVLYIQNIKADKGKARTAGRLLLLVIGAVLVAYFSPATQGIMNKILLLEDSGDVTNGRVAHWTDTLEIWKQNPIWGVGIDTMFDVYDLSSHNVYLQLLAETGIPGAISYIVLLLTSFRRSSNTYQHVLTDATLIKDNRAIYGVSLYMQVIFIVYSFFGNPAYGINFMLPYIIFVGMMDSFEKHRQRDLQ